MTNIYDKCKVTSPYRSGRHHNLTLVNVTFPNGKRTSKIYSRFLMEKKLNRLLGSNEKVTFQDGNRYNHCLDNLELVVYERRCNCIVCDKEFIMRPGTAWVRRRDKTKRGPFCSITCANVDSSNDAKTFVCPMCDKEFELVGSRLSYAISNRKKGRTGPYCSNRCRYAFVSQHLTQVNK